MKNIGEKVISIFKEWFLKEYGILPDDAIERIEDLEELETQQADYIIHLEDKLARVEEELRWSKKDAGFYHSCALSGEVPKDGSQPSTLKEQT